MRSVLTVENKKPRWGKPDASMVYLLSRDKRIKKDNYNQKME